MQNATYIVRPSQTNPGLFECFNTEREEVCTITDEQRAQYMCREYARRDAQRLMEKETLRMVVEASDSLLDEWGRGRLQNLGMVISVDTDCNGTDVKVTLSGLMTAERAASIVEALRNLELVTA